MSDSIAIRERSGRSRATPSLQVRFRDLQLGDDATAFKTLNEEWIAKYFTLEERDREILGNPDEYVLRRGGRVFMLYNGDAAVGCAALVPMGDGVYELSKMSVSLGQRGLGFGRKIIEHTIAEARAMGAKSLFLGSNTRLESAVHLYESVGFKHLPPDRVPKLGYVRANVFMDLQLEPPPTNVDEESARSRPQEISENTSTAPDFSNRFISKLLAPGPAKSIPESENFYGLIVGSWDLNVLFYREDLRTRQIKGEAHFAWVLEGKAIQDVWIVPAHTVANRPAPKSLSMCGTTLRLWNAARGKWQITWLNADTGALDRLEAECLEHDIVQTGHHVDGTSIRWVFSEITNDSFHWTGDALEADGVTWKREAEFHATRLPS